MKKKNYELPFWSKCLVIIFVILGATFIGYKITHPDPQIQVTAKEPAEVVEKGECIEWKESRPLIGLNYSYYTYVNYENCNRDKDRFAEYHCLFSKNESCREAAIKVYEYFTPSCKLVHKTGWCFTDACIVNLTRYDHAVTTYSNFTTWIGYETKRECAKYQAIIVNKDIINNVWYEKTITLPEKD